MRPCAGCVDFSIRIRSATGPSATPCSTCSRRLTAAAPTRPASPCTARPRPAPTSAGADGGERRHARAGWSRRSRAPARSPSSRSTGGNLRARIAYAGDLGDLTDLVEDVPDTEVFSIGRSMEIVKDVGDAADVEAAAPLRGFEGSHAIGHTRMATESLRRRRPLATRSGRGRSPTSRSSTTATSPTTTSCAASSRTRATASRPATTPRRSPSTSPTSWSGGESLEDALRASVHDLDGTFAYLISTAAGHRLARDRFALKPLIFAENDEMVLIASRRSRCAEVVRRPGAGAARAGRAGRCAGGYADLRDRLLAAHHPRDQPGDQAGGRRRRARGAADQPGRPPLPGGGRRCTPIRDRRSTGRSAGTAAACATAPRSSSTATAAGASART